MGLGLNPSSASALRELKNTLEDRSVMISGVIPGLFPVRLERVWETQA
jgi:hypothetical protein